MRTACLDFDGVMNTYTGWQGEAELFEPRDGLSAFLESLVTMFDCLKIHTTRKPDLVNQWLERYGLARFIAEVTNTKPPAIVYIDDRAITFNGNFTETLNMVRNFQAYWEK